MRIKKDVVTQKLSFVGIDSTDHITRKTGLSSFTVYYSLNGGTSTAMTTPTVAELDATNMEGDYTLLVDEAGMVSSAGELTINITATGMDAVTITAEIIESFESDVPSDVWNSILTGATFNIPTSAGRRVREIAGIAIHTGTAQAATATTITLAAEASVNNGVYNRNLLAITAGTGDGQTRVIVDYAGGTRVCLTDREWRITPDATSEYQILADDTPLVVDHGLTQASTNNTITIREYAAAVNDIYRSAIVTIGAGTGRGQSRIIISYNGTTKVATLCSDWVVNPDTTSVYAIMPYGISSVACISDSALADINAQVADVLKVDTIEEMAQGAPPVNPTIEEALNYLYRKLRNKQETTATEDAIYADDGTTKLIKSTISDDTVTFTKEEYGSGV